MHLTLIKLKSDFVLDPNDADSPRTSCIFPAKYSMIGQGTTVNPNEEDLSFLMGNIQVHNIPNK